MRSRVAFGAPAAVTCSSADPGQLDAFEHEIGAQNRPRSTWPAANGSASRTLEGKITAQSARSASAPTSSPCGRGR